MRNLILSTIAILGLLAGCNAQPKQSNYKVVDFNQVAVYAPKDSISGSYTAINCDTTLRASAFVQDSLITITVKGGSYGTEIKEFIIKGNLNGEFNVYLIVDSKTEDEYILYILNHVETGSTGWFLQSADDRVIRFTEKTLPCDDF